MFSNNEEKKLDWMYKGPTALVDREAYLLGRSVDKTLEEINKEEAAKAVDKYIAPPKNHVEHECIPPSIRDYNKIVKSEQVDLQAKLQEDPLVLIKRQEEETRRQFLQNPVQLKKLQEAMEAQMKRKNSSLSAKESKTDRKLRKKLKKLHKQLGIKDGYKELNFASEKNDDEAILDTILMHKFNLLKNELSEDDLKNILLGNSSGSESSDDEKYHKKGKNKRLKTEVKHESDDEHDKKRKKHRSYTPERKKSEKESSNFKERYKSNSNRRKTKECKRVNEEEKEYSYKKTRKHYTESESSEDEKYHKKGTNKKSKTESSYDESDDEHYKNKSKKHRSYTPERKKSEKESSNKDGYKSNRNNQNVKDRKKLTEEEKEAMRKKMMEYAAIRNAENAKNFRKYKEEQSKPEIIKEHDENFIKNQLLKSANSSSVADRIKANVNNIQRSKFSMESNFLK